MEQNTEVQIVCFGSPLVDFTTAVDGQFLEKYGLRPDNTYVADKYNQTIFEEIRMTAMVQVGGSVTNTARILRALKKPPTNVLYFGAIGDNVDGGIIKSQLNREGLGSNLQEIRGSTGRVAVLLKGKARTLVTDLGVSRFFTLNDTILNKIQEPCIVYFSGFFISVSFPTISIITATYKNIAFNLGAPFLSSKFPEEMTHLYNKSFLIFGNEAEHRAFGKIHNFQNEKVVDVIQATNKLLNCKSRVVIVTRGGGPVLVVRDSDWQEFEVPDLDAEVIDSNGAGDAFVGGFLARYSSGDSIRDCVECGITTARQIIQTVGFNVDFLNTF